MNKDKMRMELIEKLMFSKEYSSRAFARLLMTDADQVFLKWMNDEADRPEFTPEKLPLTVSYYISHLLGLFASGYMGTFSKEGITEMIALMAQKAAENLNEVINDQSKAHG